MLVIFFTVFLAGSLYIVKNSTKEADVKVPQNASLGDSNSMKAVKNRLDVIVRKELSFKLVQCPSYLLDMNDNRDIRGCFISELEPEAVIPLLSERFERFTNVQMGWRMDLGTWVTYRVVKNGQQSFAMSLTAPGINVDMRNDPKVNRHKTLGKYFVPHDDIK